VCKLTRRSPNAVARRRLKPGIDIYSSNCKSGMRSSTCSSWIRAARGKPRVPPPLLGTNHLILFLLTSSRSWVRFLSCASSSFLLRRLLVRIRQCWGSHEACTQVCRENSSCARACARGLVGSGTGRRGRVRRRFRGGRGERGGGIIIYSAQRCTCQ